MKNLDQKYLEDTLQMIKFLAQTGKKKQLKKNKPNRSAILQIQMCSAKVQDKVSQRLIQPLFDKCQNKRKLLIPEANRLECLLEVIQRLNSAIQKSQPSRLIKFLKLLLQILERSDHYFIMRKGFLIIVKITFVLEQFRYCRSVTEKLLVQASLQKDYSCLISGWLKVAECHAKLANFNKALEGFFQMLKFAIINK